MIITRKEARCLGCVRYDDGTKCTKCGDTVRYVSSGCCIHCRQEAAHKHTKKHKEKLYAKIKTDRRKDPEKRKEVKARSKLKAMARKKYARMRAENYVKELADLDREISRLEKCLVGTLPLCQMKDIEELLETLRENNTEEYKINRKYNKPFDFRAYNKIPEVKDKPPCYYGNLKIVKICPFCNKSFTRPKWAGKHMCAKARDHFELALKLAQLPREF